MVEGGGGEEQVMVGMFDDWGGERNELPESKGNVGASTLTSVGGFASGEKKWIGEEKT